ncbi:cytochrome-c peroxidase [Flexithrix dorotheae]|uniref:cytochrome-c peroxidase n=1 Tax=Flexithrix dorotheae TaxID=70993 RepID=UPI00036FFA1B|nr:cytochrome c peroxidase [Flexithrix dorotheae]
MKLLRFFNILVFFSFPFLLSCEEENPVEDPKPVPYDLEAELPFYFGKNYEIPDDNPMTIQGVELGRMLFYEKKLSGDNTQACASCHQQKNAFSDSNRFSTGIDGIDGTRNSMSLANLLWNQKFFWDGRANSLEEQALIPIQDPIEMHQSLEDAVAKLQASDIYPPKFKQAFESEIITAENIAKAIAQFERTLISSSSKYDLYLKGEYELTAQEQLGLDLFFTHPVPQINLRGGNCGDCHTNVLTSGELNAFDGFHNNGLDEDNDMQDEGLKNVTGNDFDQAKFKAPTLRNIALTAPYMHDGRFSTLEEVLDHYDLHIKKSTTLDPLIREASNELTLPEDPIRLFLTNEEKEAIIAFLHLLTDEEFINDPRFSDPFN